MKYFEIQNEERNNKKKETTIKKSKVLYFIILIIFPLLIIYFIQYNNGSSNSAPQRFIKNPNNTENKYNLESIKKNPYLQTKYLANGLLKRISPILSWFYMINKNYIIEILKSKSNEKYFELYNKIYIQISKDSQLTHPNIENCIVGSIFIFIGLCSMQDNISGNEILEMTKILFSHNHFNNKKNEIEYKLLSFFNDNLLKFKDKNFKKENYFSNLSNLIGLENLNKKYFEVFLNFYSKKRIILYKCFNVLLCRIFK